MTEVLTTERLVGATLRGRPAVHMQVFEEESVPAARGAVAGCPEVVPHRHPCARTTMALRRRPGRGQGVRDRRRAGATARSTPTRRHRQACAGPGPDRRALHLPPAGTTCRRPRRPRRCLRPLARAWQPIEESLPATRDALTAADARVRRGPWRRRPVHATTPTCFPGSARLAEAGVRAGLRPKADSRRPIPV